MRNSRYRLTAAIPILAAGLAGLGRSALAAEPRSPERPWRIFIVQHSHTDMGYTDYPSRLAADHIDFIEDALRLCDLTDSYPDDARFRWTCECGNGLARSSSDSSSAWRRAASRSRR